MVDHQECQSSTPYRHANLANQASMTDLVEWVNQANKQTGYAYTNQTERVKWIDNARHVKKTNRLGTLNRLIIKKPQINPFKLIMSI